jgi:putative sigma-54 modulation protein
MRILVTGRNVEISQALRDLVDRQLAKLGRVLNDSAVSAQVVLRRERHQHLSEITIHTRGEHVLHGVGQGAAWPTSLRAALAKLEKQADHLKTKWQERKRRAARRQPGLERPAPADSPPAPERIVRTDRSAIKPMTVDDAAVTLRARGDQFLVFRNAATDAVNILYRRKDGRLGLIEPEA